MVDNMIPHSLGVVGTYVESGHVYLFWIHKHFLDTFLQSQSSTKLGFAYMDGHMYFCA